MKKYLLKFEYYSYDSDSYEKSTFEMEFPSHEKLKEFYAGFRKLPNEDTFYFGNYVNMEVFKAYCIGKLNYNFWVETGGVSTNNIHAFEVDTQEISLN